MGDWQFPTLAAKEGTPPKRRKSEPQMLPPPPPQPTAGGRGGRELCMRRGREEKKRNFPVIFSRRVCVSLSLSPLRPPTQCGREKNTGGC